MSGPSEPDRDPVSFADLARLVLAGQNLPDVLELIVNLAVSAIAGVDGASVSVVVRDGQRFETTNASSASIRQIDEAQYERAEGPCVEAIRTAAEVTVRLPVERWPDFSGHALGEGILSVTSLPLSVEERTLGALNLYSRTAPALDPAATAVARGLGAQAAVVVANAAALTVAEMTNQQLQEALETRDLIGQAKGILMARERIDADRAFDILRRASQRTNRKLRDIAAEIIDRHQSRDK